jgi:hypothetical protein
MMRTFCAGVAFTMPIKSYSLLGLAVHLVRVPKHTRALSIINPD